MKKTFYYLIFIALCIVSCKKEPKLVGDPIIYENIYKETNKVMFDVIYEYPTVLREVKIHLASNANMNDTIVCMANINGKQFNATIEGLEVNTRYYYLYEYFTGTTSSKSNVNSFHNKPLTPMEINGVKWAPCNVGAPNFFTNNPEDAGMFYQWGSNVGWSSNDPLTASDGDNAWRILNETGDDWQSSKNPCPPGYRVPTMSELERLTNTSQVTREWTTKNGVLGCCFTDKTTADYIFLPAAGCRWGYYSYSCYGRLSIVGTDGIYWSSTPNIVGGADHIQFNEYYLYTYYNGGYRAHGSSIRCVAEQ